VEVADDQGHDGRLRDPDVEPERLEAGHHLPAVRLTLRTISGFALDDLEAFMTEAIVAAHGSAEDEGPGRVLDVVDDDLVAGTNPPRLPKLFENVHIRMSAARACRSAPRSRDRCPRPPEAVRLVDVEPRGTSCTAREPSQLDDVPFHAEDPVVTTRIGSPAAPPAGSLEALGLLCW